MKIKTCIVLFSVSAVLSGCAIGPTWKSDVVLPEPMKSIRGKRIVVSDFLRSTAKVSVTQTQRIKEIKESVHVHDISGQIAQKLREKGVDAEAMDALKSSSLHADEVLVRGAVIAGDVPENLPARMFVACTAGIFGCLLPSPVPFDFSGTVTYRVDIVDADKRILVQTGEKKAVAEYTDYYAWGWEGKGEKTKEDTAAAVTDKIVAQLAEMVRVK